MTSAIFAIPGDKDQRTGGYLYNAHVLDQLNANGLVVSYLRLPDSFPEPSPEDLSHAHRLLTTMSLDVPVIIDGLALGAMKPDAISSIEAPVIALVHHPLGLETGLAADRSAVLIANERAVLAHVAHVIVTSWHTAEVLVADFDVPSSRITVALPGFDRPSLPRIPSVPPTILSVGLLAQRKGHDVLLSALAEIADLDWRAEIVGRAHDASFAETLQKQALDLGLEHRVRFRGEVGAAELQDAYARATVFALATRYEGYGMVLSEAMLHSLPIVSCSVGAVPHTVGDAGILVPPDEPKAFGAALRTILTQPHAAETYAKNACRLAKNLPNWSDTAAVFEDVIEKVSRRASSLRNQSIMDPECLP